MIPTIMKNKEKNMKLHHLNHKLLNDHHQSNPHQVTKAIKTHSYKNHQSHKQIIQQNNDQALIPMKEVLLVHSCL